MIFRRQIVSGAEARAKLLAGFQKLADPVGSTLGPRGRNVAVEIYKGVDIAPKVWHDGVSVARAINLEDPLEDMGARLLKDAAITTNLKAGDGTTTATILASAILTKAFEAIGSGANPMQVKAEIETALKVVLSKLSDLKEDIKGLVKMEQIASISAASEEIGKLVAEALEKVGTKGIVSVEEGQSLETTVDYKQGMELDRGYLSSYFITNQERSEAVLEKPLILLTDKKLNYAKDILPFLEKFVAEGHKSLVIFAGEVVEEALATLVVNKMKGNIEVVAVQAPSFGDRRKDELEDIASFVGGQVLLEETGREITTVQISELGRADKVVVDRDKTIIFSGAGNTTKRVSELTEQVKLAKTGYEKDTKEKRLANLSGSIAVINVGGVTDVEIQERKERVIDAVSATKAAVEEGVVAGGEITLLTASQEPNEAFNTVGGRILKEALKAPFKRLVENSGLDYAESLQKLTGQAYPMGIDVLDGQVKDLIKSGIIDPVKVTRYALENATSVACMAITTDTLVADLPEAK